MRMLGDVTSTNFFRVMVRLIAYGGGTPLTFELPAWDFADSLWVFLDILLATTAGMPGADELCVFFEAGRDRLAAMCIAFHELDHIALLLLFAPHKEGVEVGEDEGVAIVRVA